MKGPNQLSKQDASDIVEDMFDKYDTNRDMKLSYTGTQPKVLCMGT